MRLWGPLVLIASLLACKTSKRELPPADPPDMKRAEGTKLTIPMPEGYRQVTTGTARIDELVATGGVAIAKPGGGPEPPSIVVNINRETMSSWSTFECKVASETAATKLGAPLTTHGIEKLQTGDACAFITEDSKGIVREFYIVAGKPTYTVTCRTKGKDLAVSAQCEHIASWIRER